MGEERRRILYFGCFCFLILSRKRIKKNIWYFCVKYMGQIRNYRIVLQEAVGYREIVTVNVRTCPEYVSGLAGTDTLPTNQDGYFRSADWWLTDTWRLLYRYVRTYVGVFFFMHAWGVTVDVRSFPWYGTITIRFTWEAREGGFSWYVINE